MGEGTAGWETPMGPEREQRSAGKEHGWGRRKGMGAVVRE